MALSVDAQGVAAAVAACRANGPLVQCITNFVSMASRRRRRRRHLRQNASRLAASHLVVPPSGLPCNCRRLLSHTRAAGHHGQHPARRRRLPRHGEVAAWQRWLCLALRLPVATLTFAARALRPHSHPVHSFPWIPRTPSQKQALQLPAASLCCLHVVALHRPCLPLPSSLPALLLGAHPQAHSIGEVEDFVALASAVLINVGTLSEGWVGGMKLAAARAGRLGKPWVLDPVGCGATPYRSKVGLCVCVCVRERERRRRWWWVG